MLQIFYRIREQAGDAHKRQQMHQQQRYRTQEWRTHAVPQQRSRRSRPYPAAQAND